MESLLRAASAAIDDGVVEATLKERTRYWLMWTKWLGRRYPFLDPHLTWDRRRQRQPTTAYRQALLAAYCLHVRYCKNIHGSKTVRATSVIVALRAISAKCKLDGQHNFVVEQERKYPQAIGQIIEGFRRTDPPKQPQLAVPLEVVIYIYLVKHKSISNKQQAIGDLCLIAFYYLLKVGEYCYQAKSSNTRTT